MTVTDAPVPVDAAPPATDTAAVDHGAALRKAGATYARKQKAADTAREAMAVVIRNAYAGGMTKTDITRSAGVARETVYKALRGVHASADDIAASPHTATADDGTTVPLADLPALETGERASA